MNENKFKEWKDSHKAVYSAHSKLTALNNELKAFEDEIHNRKAKIYRELDKADEDRARLHKEWLNEVAKHYLEAPNKTGIFALWLIGAKGAGFAINEEFWFSTSPIPTEKTIIFNSIHEAARSIPNFSSCHNTGAVERVIIKELRVEEKVVKSSVYGLA